MDISKDQNYPSEKLVNDFEFLHILDQKYEIKELHQQLEKGQRDLKPEFEVFSTQKHK